MIISAEIISRPDSGDYTERTYGKASVGNSQSWTWIKFTEHDYSEWCGQFGGIGKAAISHNTVLIMTSDYLFLLDRNTGDQIDITHNFGYRELAVAPNGNFILADFYDLSKITDNIRQVTAINEPYRFDCISFKSWKDEKLEFTCEDFLQRENKYLMTYDSITDKIEIKSPL
jgi:hypothetical protein